MILEIEMGKPCRPYPCHSARGVVRRKGGPERPVQRHCRKGLLGLLVRKQLFSIEALSGATAVKGGTSLSKIFHAINRFLEDIDLAVDDVALGFTDERDPRQEYISKTRRPAFLADMMVACQRYIGDVPESPDSTLREGAWQGASLAVSSR